MFELIAAPLTPLTESGELNLDPVARYADHLRATGCTGALVAGSTGEGPSLTSTERRRLAERWIEVGDGLRIIVQVGHQSPREARELARHAAGSGASAVCAAPPSWFALSTTEALAATCGVIAAGAPDLPFFYYHIPGLSGVHVPMAPFLDLARDRIPNLAGVKYTHLDGVDFQACIRDHGAEMQLFWGVDELLLTGLHLGAHGAIGSTYSFGAPLYRRLMEAHGRGDMESAKKLQSQAALLIETLFRRGYMAAAKTVMGFLGVDCGPVRPPLVGLEDEAAPALRAELEGLGFFDWVREPEPS